MSRNNKAIKYLVSVSAAIIAIAVVGSYLPSRGEEKIYSDVIRLHVVASSDSEEDQSLKLKVRDELLELVSTFPAAKCTDEASRGIESHIGEIEECARRTLAAEGSDDAVEVFFDKETYPERYYEGFSLPAGEYLSLRVVIGEGAGHNWWCVLFPPLCSAAGEEDQKEDFIAAGFTSEQYSLISSSSGTKYKVRFKILEILSEVFGFDY